MIIQQIYTIVGMKIPEVIEYKSLEECLNNYDSWKEKCKTISAMNWAYLLPMLHPCSYTAQYELSNFGYQPKLVRERSLSGQLHVTGFAEKSGLGNIRLKEIYDEAKGTLRFDETDNLSERIYDDIELNYPHIGDYISDLHDLRYPTSQCRPWEFGMLCPSQIFKEEVEIFKYMCIKSGLSDNYHVYNAIQEFASEYYGYFTFDKFVLKFPIK